MESTSEFAAGTPAWGTGGREFKSRRSDHKINYLAGISKRKVFQKRRWEAHGKHSEKVALKGRRYAHCQIDTRRSPTRKMTHGRRFERPDQL